MKRKKIFEIDQSIEIDDEFFEAISSIRSTEEAKNFLEDLCTPAELQAMKDRWKVIDLIHKNIPYRKIYEITGVSATTVGRVARCFLMGSGGYSLIYKRLQKRKNHEKIQVKNSTTKERSIK
jgi:TrpR-related protein YerC/YecD